MVPSRPGVARHPATSLVWLQRSHSPWPLLALVGPPAAAGVTWSACRIGAPHHGVRQNRSRMVRNWRSPSGNSRRLDSIATSCPVRGRAYNRRSHTGASLFASSLRACSAGTGPYPGSSPGCSRPTTTPDRSSPTAPRPEPAQPAPGPCSGSRACRPSPGHATARHHRPARFRPLAPTPPTPPPPAPPATSQRAPSCPEPAAPSLAGLPPPWQHAPPPSADPTDTHVPARSPPAAGPTTTQAPPPSGGRPRPDPPATDTPSPDTPRSPATRRSRPG